jgi:Proteasome subunit
MTTALAGFTPLTREYIVTVSDARLSHGDDIPAVDEGTRKNRKFASTWGMMFAASDVSAFVPVMSDIWDKFSYTMEPYTTEPKAPPASADAVRHAIQSAYEKEFQERFFREHLARFGYSDISEFRRTGYEELGKDLYSEYAIKLAKFNLGLELLVYGFDDRGAGYLYEVANPGKVISHNLRGFAAIGSGAWMALAALNRRPLSQGITGNNVAETVYRLLDAKFSSETASGVGHATHVFIMGRGGKVGHLSDDEIRELRAIWDEQMRTPEPEKAVNMILNSKALRSVFP